MSTRKLHQTNLKPKKKKTEQREILSDSTNQLLPSFNLALILCPSLQYRVDEIKRILNYHIHWPRLVP
jgi:hypothetical protein